MKFEKKNVVAVYFIVILNSINIHSYSQSKIDSASEANTLNRYLLIKFFREKHKATVKDAAWYRDEPKLFNYYELLNNINSALDSNIKNGGNDFSFYFEKYGIQFYKLTIAPAFPLREVYEDVIAIDSLKRVYEFDKDIINKTIGLIAGRIKIVDTTVFRGITEIYDRIIHNNNYYKLDSYDKEFFRNESEARLYNQILKKENTLFLKKIYYKKTIPSYLFYQVTYTYDKVSRGFNVEERFLSSRQY